MTRTIDYAKCPQCGKKFEPGFANYWMSTAFSEYSCNQTSHICEQCNCHFRITIKQQVVFNTSTIKQKVQEGVDPHE